jgi:cytochrome c
MFSETMVIKAGIVMAALAATGGAQAAVVKGDPVAGQKVYAKCQGCHAIGAGAVNKIGPHLNGIVGKKAAMVPGYTYSSALQNAKLTWKPATLDSFLIAPKAAVPGTKMLFMGLPNAKDRADVIAYIGQYNAAGATKK